MFQVRTACFFLLSLWERVGWGCEAYTLDPHPFRLSPNERGTKHTSRVNWSGFWVLRPEFWLLITADCIFRGVRASEVVEASGSILFRNVKIEPAEKAEVWTRVRPDRKTLRIISPLIENRKIASLTPVLVTGASAPALNWNSNMVELFTCGVLDIVLSA